MYNNIYHGGSANKKAWGSSGSIPSITTRTITLPFHTNKRWTCSDGNLPQFLPPSDGLIAGSDAYGYMIDFPGKDIYMEYNSVQMFAIESNLNLSFINFKLVGYLLTADGFEKPNPLDVSQDPYFDICTMQFVPSAAAYRPVYFHACGTSYYPENPPVLLPYNQFHLAIQCFGVTGLYPNPTEYVQSACGYVNLIISTPAP